MKCVLSTKESNFNGINGSTFSHLRTVRAEGADPPAPPLTVNLTVKYPCFYDFPWVALKKLMVNFRT